MVHCRGAARSSVLVLCVAAVAAGGPPQVRTSSGTVIGELLPEDAGAGGVAVEQFLGVPFATAPRFEPPQDYRQPYPGGAVQAQMWGPACMQIAGDPTKTYGSEDCLKANVWKPQPATPQSRLPVMVFIYGGSNQYGEAEPYNMSALAAFHQVVCVSFNYRTGPIGWMSFQEDLDGKRSTGNWGILDIQSVLRWVQREVANFGGDAARVAIHGQSSGGGLVELQYVSPGSKGLFHGAISESGGLDAMDTKSALRSSADVAKSVGCLTAQGAANKTCLQLVPAINLTTATYSGEWGPSVDGVTFPDSPEVLLEQGLVNEATIVVGAQTNDTNLFLFRSYTKDGEGQPNDHPDGALKAITPVEYKASLMASVGIKFLAEALHLYPADAKDGRNNVHQLGNVGSDQGHCSNRQRASLFNKVHPGRAFVYRFDYWYTSNAKCSAVPNYHLPYLGAVHQDEVTFVLGQPNFMEDGSCCGVWGLTTDDCPHLPTCQACYDPQDFGRSGYRAYFNDKEWEFAKTVGSFWTNVAASGHPSCRDRALCDSSVQAWPAFEDGGRVEQNIVFNATLPGGSRMEATPYGRPEICSFWDRVSASKRTGEQIVV